MGSGYNLRARRVIRPRLADARFFLQQDMCAIADGPRFSHSGAAIVGEAEKDEIGLHTVRNLIDKITRILEDKK